jgi:hypothetical protein
MAVPVMAGWFGYVLLFHFLHREEKFPGADSWGLWWVNVVSLIMVSLVAVGIGALFISAIHFFWKPQLELGCQQCGYPIRNLSGDHCSECGHSIAHLRN